jgi:SPP1 gp7 family putative phage head morphogenesis protein
MTSADISGDIKGFADPLVELLDKFEVFDSEESPRRALTAALWTETRAASILKNKSVAYKMSLDELPINYLVGYLKETGQFNKSASQKYVEKRALGLVKDLTRTDITRIRSYLLAQWPVNKYEFRLFLKEHAYICSDVRADLIHRTEMHTAAEAGHFQVAKDVGRRYKTWNAIIDHRTRPRHRELNQTRVLITEAFSNGLMYPNEPRCRCWLTYQE